LAIASAERQSYVFERTALCPLPAGQGRPLTTNAIGARRMAKSPLPEFRPWREFFPAHPAAETFPLMAPDQLAELAKDIAENGVFVPIESSRMAPP
jgi:hypothetical protein